MIICSGQLFANFFQAITDCILEDDGGVDDIDIDVAIFDNNNDWNLFKIAVGPFKSVSIRNPDNGRLLSTKKMVKVSL